MAPRHTSGDAAAAASDDFSMTTFLAEFVGTFALVIAIGCHAIVGDSAWGPTSVASTLAALTYALRDTSGAHFNPAVSVACGLSRKMGWDQVASYCGIQVLAGLVGSGCLQLALGTQIPLHPAPSYSWYDVALVEALYTCMLCFVVLNVAAAKSVKDQNQYYGLAIGFVLVAAGHSAGHVSGGAFNPAVSLGAGLFGGSPGISSVATFMWGMAYSVFQLVGAALAAGLFRAVRPDDFAFDLECLPLSHTRESARSRCAGFLHVRVLAACDLRLWSEDKGLQVPDAYVVARIGHSELRTPIVPANAHPVWDSGNDFSFELGPRDATLEFEVKHNSRQATARRKSSTNYADEQDLTDLDLGFCSVQLSDLPYGHWVLHTSRLSDNRPEGNGLEEAVLEVEVLLHCPSAGPAPSYEIETRLAAEFVGCFFLVLTIGLNVLGQSTQPIFSIAAVLLCFTFALRGVSGAHFNPSVTLACYFTSANRRLSGADAFRYVGAQVAGGIIGALFYSGIEHHQSFPLAPGVGFGWHQVVTAETLFTFIFCFIVLSVSAGARASELSEYSGLAVGMGALGASTAIGAISGGVLNPAISIGVATAHASAIHSFGFWRALLAIWSGLIYALFQLAGGAMAAALFYVIHPSLYVRFKRGQKEKAVA